MGGRRPLPTEVKKVRGNPGKRPLNENEPEAQAGEPKMPADLPELAQQEWKSIVPLLLKLSVLTEVDGKALAAYCYCFARWIQAEKEVADRGILIEEPIVSRETGEIMGYKVKKNPAIPIVNEALRGMKSYLIEFGLTPASRSRLHVEKEKPVDPADLYFSKKNLTGKHVN